MRPSRRRCRKCVFCPSQRVAACWPCWTDGPTGASPDSEAGASRSQSSTTERLGRLSLPSRLTHRLACLCSDIPKCLMHFFFFFFFFVASQNNSLNVACVSGLCRHTVSHIAKLFKEKGSDCWWELPVETLLPADVLKKVSSSVGEMKLTWSLGLKPACCVTCDVSDVSLSE